VSEPRKAKNESIASIGRARGAALLLAAAILAAGLSSCAARPKRIRVGVLCNLMFFAPTFDGFKQRLAELGYRDGERISYDYRYSNTEIAAARVCLDDFIRDRVDLIFAFPTEAAIEAKLAGAAAGIPVLFANSNIEGVGLVDSVRSPGKGITGVRYPGPDITVKRFEVMAQIAPRAKRYVLPYLRGIPIIPAQLDALFPVADAAGVSLDPRPFSGAEAIEAYFRSLPPGGKAPFDAILMIAEPLMVIEDSFVPFAAYAAPRRIPMGGAMMGAKGYASIFGVSTDNTAVGRQAADLAAKIFKGVEPGNIPVVSAEYFLEIDLGAAERAGVEVPESLMKRANRIIR
jgi:putative tryptophan/tyrosine transport system substrate-binding protein